MAVNPRSLTVEADWLPGSFREIVALRRRLLAAGYSRPVADGLVGWLVAKSAGDEDLTAAQTRSDYRRILATLGPSPERSPRGSGRRATPGSRKVGSDLRRAA